MKLTRTSLTLSLIVSLFQEGWRGKSMSRILLNEGIKNIPLKGKILDLGAGKSKASYHRFLQLQKPHEIYLSDFYTQDKKSILKINLEENFSLPDKSFDTVLCFNVLEHIFNYTKAIQEVMRILKTGGTFLGFTPFLIGYHPDPHDFFRYTQEALEKMFESEKKLELKRLVFIGFGPLCLFTEAIEGTIPKIFKPFFFLTAVLLDSVLERFSSYYRERFPLGYLFLGQKRGNLRHHSAKGSR